MNLAITAFGGTQITVGQSAIIRVTPSAYQRTGTMKIISGAGTLWVNPLTPLALTGTSAAALLGTGYPLGASEVFSVGGPATFYLSAKSADMVVGILVGYTTGVSLI